MSEYFETMGEIADLKKRREICETAIHSHRESLRRALPVAADVEEINGEYVVQLAITLNERLMELKGYDKKIKALKSIVGQ